MDEVFRQMWKDLRVLWKPAALMAATWIVFAFTYHLTVLNPFLNSVGWPLAPDPEQAGRMEAALAEQRLRLVPLLAVQGGLYLFFHLALIVTCRQARDKRPDLRRALGDSLRRWPRYIGAALLLVAVAISVGSALFLAANALAPPPPGQVVSLLQPHFTPIHGTALGAGAALALYLGLRLNLFPFAIGIDGAGPLAGLRKSWQLTRGRWWSMFFGLVPLGILLLLMVVTLGILLSLPFTLPAGLTPLFALPTGTYPPGAYPPGLSWNQGATLGLVTTLLVFFFDVPFVYGHTVVWEIAKQEFTPSRPTASYAKKYVETARRAPEQIPDAARYAARRAEAGWVPPAWRPPPKE